jgi:hypothetical protein
MSSHATHRHEGRKHKHHRPLQRGGVNGSLPVARSRGSQGLAEALRRALEELQAERLQTTHRANPADDDEDPTRRAGGRNT